MFDPETKGTKARRCKHLGREAW